MAYYGQPMMGGGMPTATVSGVDMNRDGIPDQLQGGMMGAPMMGAPMMGAPMMGGYPQPMMGGYPQPMMGGMGMGGYPQQPSVMGAAYAAGLRPTDYNRNGIPDRMEGGAIGLMGKILPDRNGDGIPDILQGRRRY